MKAVLERTYGVPVFQEQVMQLAVVAAGFTPGEADQLRRAMAAWRRTGNLGPFEVKLREGLRRHGYSQQFAAQIGQQIKGFGEYGFPESHAASFALLAYASAWIKRHEPAAFLCSLLNSQPMGFYAASQLCRDAMRHGVEIRPVDVNRSDWDCTLEPADGAQPAVRLGFRMISGFAEDSAQVIVTSTGNPAVQERCGPGAASATDRASFKRLARAGAMATMEGHRHVSFWAALGIEMPWELGDVDLQEASPMLAPPTEGQDILADYAASASPLGRHPLELIREHLDRRGVITAEKTWEMRDDQYVHVAGIVTHRQRPESAHGTVFATLEDETGMVNVIVWPDLVDRQRRTLLRSSLLGIKGKVQFDGYVMQVIAKELVDHTPLLGRLRAESRDFR